MKIITLSGEDTTKSYDRLQKFVDEARKRNWEIVRYFDPKDDVFELLGRSSLFVEKRILIIENPGILNKKDLMKLLAYKDDELTVVLYYDRDLTPLVKKQLKEAGKIEEFPLPKIIWNFLDSFYPGNKDNVLKLLHTLLLTTPFEVVMVLLVRHLRDLVWVQTDSPPKYPSWRFGKLKSQGKRYKDGVIEEMIAKLAEIDYQSKSGQGDPLTALDFLIAEKLQ